MPVDELKLEYYFEDMEACPVKKAFLGIDYPWEALEKKNIVADFSRNENHGKVHPTVVMTGNVYIGEGTEIDPYVVIEGPAVIGRNCKIRPFALIRPGTILGDNVVLGNGCEAKNIIAFNEAKIQSHAFTGDSIIGKGARLGSGVILANRRFDQKNAKVIIKGKSFDIGKDKCGGIIGDYVRLGANCITAPGVMIGKHTWIYGGASISGFIEKEKMVKLRQDFEIVEKSKQVLSRIDMKGKI
jgi:bifunctional UDP-N-acetylglucosamine pyrophosphorylase/glucosamine-1-phosphate N-acetyltransferase